MFKGKALDLMSKKGIYLYDNMDSFDKFNQRELPKKEQIYSILYDENISDEQYKHAKKFGEDLNLKTWVTFMIFIYYLIFY